MISLKNISKRFYIKKQITHALDNVSLEINKGDIYGVVGESGAGKSTLIRCVNLLERPSSGSVIVDDTNLMTLSHQKLLKVRHGIGMIFQHFNLLGNRNVFDNIALPLELIGVKKVHIHKKVQSLLEITGLEDRSMYYPAQLSGGQKQRVAIARALAADTKILLSDEATSALDPKTTDAILNLLNNINRELGVTILMITHEMEVVKKICNKVALLDQGRLVEHNLVKNFFSNPQSDLGRKFIQQLQDFDIPPFYKDKIQSSGNYPIVKMIFNSDHVQSPILSALTKQFSIDVNIVQAKIEQLQSSTTGMLIAELIADNAQLKDGLTWLNTQSLKTEVLGYVD